MPGLKISMDVELEALRENMIALGAMTRKTARQCVQDVSVMLLQAGSGKNGVPESKQKKREIQRFVRRYRHGVEELVQDARPEAPGDKLLFLIRRPRNRRPIAKSGDRRFWVFETMAAAKAHQAITYRGVAKAGFWSQYPALGKPVPAKYAKKGFLASVPGLSETAVMLESPVPEITVSNRSTAIGFEKSDFWKKGIISSVNNRISGMAKRNEKRLAAFRQAGGVSWNEEKQEYDIL